MRISDWSSDVCSPDLRVDPVAVAHEGAGLFHHDVTCLQTADDFYESAVLDAGFDFGLPHHAIVNAAADGAVPVCRDGGERPRERCLSLHDALGAAVHAGAASALLADTDPHDADR